MVTIAHVIIAGEFNDGEGTRFTQKFRVEYQRTEQGPWESYESQSGEVSNDYIHPHPLISASEGGEVSVNIPHIIISVCALHVIPRSCYAACLFVTQLWEGITLKFKSYSDIYKW